MAVTTYPGKNGEVLWKVAVQARSASNPSIRVQKAKFSITSERGLARKRSRKLGVGCCWSCG